MYDLIVIGGGPAGTAAAITCARSGARVLLLERGRFPRHKVCGEFVSAESLCVLAGLLGSDNPAVLRDAIRISKARVFVDDRTLQTEVEPVAASIARLDLDAALWQSAQHSGVEAKQQVTVRNIGGTDPFLVATSSGDFEARAVINASGRRSGLNPALSGNGKAHTKWIGLKAHFSEASPSASVDLYFFEGGYCGVQPVRLKAEANRGRVNACAMVRADVARTVSEVLMLHPGLRERARRWESLSDPVSTSPLLFDEPRTNHKGTLLVGDAAGFVDPFVGDGISLALRSGVLAAECLIPFFAGKFSLQEATLRYGDAYSRRLAPVFRVSSTIRRMLFLPRILRSPLLRLVGSTPAITRYLVKKTR